MRLIEALIFYTLNKEKGTVIKMEKVRVELGKKSYDIIIGYDIISSINEYIKNYDKIIVFSNEKIGKIYSERLINILKEKNKNVFYYEIPDGEEYKTIETILPVYDFMVENNFDRSSLLISLGGGVVCDMGGYIASTFMRGIDFIQIPTSLLAQVDASIGGKVAVNHKKGKNMIGSFYQPKLVYIDTSVLSTLDEREIKTGIAEIIKHAVIYDENYFDYLLQNSDKLLGLDKEVAIKSIKRSCEIKAEIVSQDETEKGVRAYLNYGHTYGHVIENLTKYKIYRHGEAVVYGMMFAAYLAEYLNITDRKFINRQIEIFEKYGLSYTMPLYYYPKVLEILKHDKKVKAGKLIFVLPERIGKVNIAQVEEEKIEKYYETAEGKKVKSIIDIGTNTVRLFTAEVLNGKISNKYGKYLSITRLGEDVDKNKYLKKEAIDRNIEVLKEYRRISDEYGAIEIKAKATSATRDSQNRDEFINRAYSEAGIKIETITGEEEGRYAFNGVLTDNFSKDVLVVDIGGGSTEFIYGAKNNIKFIKSINAGSVRIKEKFFADDKYVENYKRAEEWVLEQFQDIKELKEKDFIIVGVAGTITTQVSMIKEMEEYNPEEIHRYNLTLNEIKNNLKLLENKNIAERKCIKGLDPKRADVIVSGTFFLKCILEFFSKESIFVSENDILEGIMEGI